MDSPEEWRDIAGYEGFYQVSDHGHVKALARVVEKIISKPGINGSSPRQSWAERILKTTTGRTGYPRVMLRRNAQKETFSVHQLVLLAWVGEPPTAMQACHNDGNRSNNHLDNLRWDTPKNNHADKKRHGTQPLGQDHHNAKLTNATVLAIRSDTRSLTAIAREYGITKENVSMIRRGISWRHLPTPPHPPHTGKGEQNSQHKLTEADVRAIRDDTRKQYVIAREYGVTRTLISRIQRRKRWQHIP